MSMNPVASMDPALAELLEKMGVAKQLSASDSGRLIDQQGKRGNPPIRTEEDVLRWLALEYGVGFTSLDDIEPDKEVLSLFPARLLLKNELLPLRRVNGCVEIA